MKKLLPVFALILAAHVYADKPECPSIDAIKKVGFTDAGLASFFSGQIWMATATDHFGTPYLWEMGLPPLDGKLDTKEEAIESAQNVLANIISVEVGEAELDEEDQHWTCSYYVIYKSKSDENSDEECDEEQGDESEGSLEIIVLTNKPADTSHNDDL